MMSDTKLPLFKIDDGIIISVLSSNVKTYIHEIKLKNYHRPKRKKHCFLCRSQTNSLLLILGAYVTIFSIASIILVMSVLKLQNLNENEKFTSEVNTSEEMYKTRYNLMLLEERKLFKEFMWPIKNSVFNCSSLSDVKNFRYLTSGWTKNVFSFEYKGKNYALKTININGTDMINCLKKHTNKVCFEKASSKMYKEYILSRELSHPNIIKVLAWCVGSNSISSSDVAVIFELCSPIDIIYMLRLSFQQRLKIMLDLSHLITYLANSPLGSVAINDFQRQQFVMCGNILKLTDLDDLSIDEPKCNSQNHCSQQLFNQSLELDHNSKPVHHVECINNICLGYNEKQNVINTYKHFVHLFLNITTPVEFKGDVKALFNAYTSGQEAKIIKEQTEVLYHKYKKLFKGNVYLH